MNSKTRAAEALDLVRAGRVVGRGKPSSGFVSLAAGSGGYEPLMTASSQA